MGLLLQYLNLVMLLKFHNKEKYLYKIALVMIFYDVSIVTSTSSIRWMKVVSIKKYDKYEDIGSLSLHRAV